MIDGQQILQYDNGRKGVFEMEIGSKIRNARNEAGLTQEKAAEELGVTRQTISNWENNKSYPDIISVIKMSDLYSISLDSLLKEDKDMKSTYLEHLEESTNVVKSQTRKSRIITVGIYLVAWVLLIVLFWLGEGGALTGNEMGYSLLAFYIILPVVTVVTAFFIGKDQMWGVSKWFMVIFYGIMYMLSEYATFSLSNMIYNEYSHFNLPEFGMFFAGAIMAAIGIAVGMLVAGAAARKAKAKAQAS